MQRVWDTIKSYILWTHNRGSFHYDVMVTVILLFIFLTPRGWFRDKPVEHRPHQTEVVVQPDGNDGFIYEVDSSAVSATSEDGVRSDLLRVIEPIAGEVSIDSYETIRDIKGRVTLYKVRVRR